MAQPAIPPLETERRLAFQRIADRSVSGRYSLGRDIGIFADSDKAVGLVERILVRRPVWPGHVRGGFKPSLL